MFYIKIEKNPDGSHAAQVGGTRQKGWAYVPEHLRLPDTFPYVNIDVIDNTVVSITEGEKIILEPTDDELRMMRRTQCFKYINRGTLWYDRLTEEQIAELDVWYDDWLDVTITRVIPEKPEWLE